jgi:hypothetical protein
VSLLGCRVTAGTWIAHNPPALTVSYKIFLYSQQNIHKMFTGCRNILVREQTIPTERPPTYIKSWWLAKALLGHSFTIWQLSDPPPLRGHNSLFEEPLFSPLAKFSVWTAVILFESVCVCVIRQNANTKQKQSYFNVPWDVDCWQTCGDLGLSALQAQTCT